MTDLSLSGTIAPPPRAKERPGILSSGPRLVGFSAGLLVLNIILYLSHNLLGDPDTHWHVAVGRWILENGEWPRVDVFSHTFAGEPWIAKEWLSQVMMFGAYQVGGWPVVGLLGAACVSLAIGMSAAWMGRTVRGPAIGVLVILMFLVSSASILSRPHAIALPLMAAWIIGVLDAVENRRAPHWIMLPVMLLWANAHAGYTIGFLIAGVMALEAVRDAGAGRRLHAAAQWALFLVLAIAASCLTPYGYESLRVTQKLFAGDGREAIAYVDEWRSLTLDLQGVTGLILLAALLVGLALQPWRNIVRIGLVLIIAWMMIRHARFALLFGFTAIPIAIEAIAAGPLARWIGPRKAQSGALAPSVLWILLAVALLQTPTVEISPKTTPAAAVASANALGLTRLKVYNSYNFGGYLISQGIPTFIDGRTDQLFLRGFFDAFASSKQPGNASKLKPLLAKHEIGWALVQADSGERKNLEELGWIVRHSDEVATVLTPPS